MRRCALVRLVVLFVLASVACCSESEKLTVRDIYPTVGPYHGGDPVTIRGTGFQRPSPQGVRVYFGKKEARSPVIVSNTELRVDPPMGQINEVVDVEVVFDDSRFSKLPKAYKYIDPLGAPGQSH
ncbi:MAG: IPT/TIG domain-containing protein [Pseudomonadota bacterium]